MGRLGAIRKRLKSDFHNPFISPSLAHQLLFPKYTMLRGKKQFLPYGMPFKDLQSVEDYEESVARFARKYRWATPDELIMWGLDSYESKKRKRGEPKTLSVSTKRGDEALQKYANRLQETLEKCVIGDSDQSSIIWTTNPRQNVFRADAYVESRGLDDYSEGDVIFNVEMSNRQAKLEPIVGGKRGEYGVGKSYRYKTIPTTKMNLGVHIDGKTYGARNKIKYRYESRSYTNSVGSQIRYQTRIPESNTWYFAQPFQDNVREKNLLKRYLNTIAKHEAGEDNTTKQQVLDAYPRYAYSHGLERTSLYSLPMSQPYGRNKAMFLVPYEVIDSLNYGTINNSRTIADIYPFNPTYDWDSEKEEGEPDA